MNNNDNLNYSASKTLKRLFSISKRYIPWYIALCTAAVVRAMLGVLDTEGFRQMINGATSSKISMVKYGVVLGFIALALGLILDAFIDYFGEILNYKSTRDLQSKLLKKLTKIKMINYEKYHSGNIIDRLDNCASAAQTGMNTNTRTILENSLVVIFSSAYLIFLNFRLMVSTLIFIALLPIIVTPLAKALRGLYDKTQATRVVKDSFVQDSFQGGEIVRTFNLSDRLGKTYFSKFNAFVKITKRILFFEGLMFSTHWIIIFGGDLFILGYGGYLSTKGIISVGSVVSFLLMFERIMDPISSLANIWPQFQLSLSSANKVFELLDLPEENENSNTSQNNIETVLKHNSDIAVKNIFFGYNEGTQILKGTNFVCENGKVTALVGPSGGGKSTLLKMLIKLYEPQSGDILYGDVPLKGINNSLWRKSIAYVSQDPLLFSGTIIENIKYGSEDVSDEAAIEAAKAASIHETIMNTQDGYASKIGEQGVRLSGGERQRISIARAMLRNPEILILDEPTSALDSENEKLIQQALEVLMKGRTTIIVAHRLSTIQNSDKIVFIEDGIVCEEGTHNVLMEKKGKYYDIHEKMKQTVELGAQNEVEEDAI